MSKWKKINFNRIIESKSELAFYEKLARDIIPFLEINGKKTFEEIITFLGGSDRRTLRLLNELVRLNIVTYRNGYFIAKNPKNYSLYSGEVLCKECNGKLVSKKTSIYARLKKFMKEINKERPRPTFIFDQRPVTPETTINRALYATWRRDIHSKRIAIIGDDDLTSLAIGFLGIAKEIVVFEIDQRLNKFIKEINSRYKSQINPPIKIVSQDILKNLPKKFIHKFDVFMTDPTPSLTPFIVFINSGIKLLKRGAGNVGYTSIYPSHSTKIIEFQKALTKMNLLITDFVPFFTEYAKVEETFSPADKAFFKKFSNAKMNVSFFESLLRVESVKNTKPKPIITSMEAFWGGATKRILKEPAKDPAIKNERKTRSYLLEEAERLIKERKKRLRMT